MNQRSWFWISSGLAALALLLALWQLPRTPLPWFDEVLLVSTSRSVAAGHSAVPSVLSDFPHTGRYDLFYGPVIFWIGSATLKIFGLSLWSWRLLGWFSGVTIVLSSAWLVRRLGGSTSSAAMAALLVTLAPSMGSGLTSGRTDTLTIALELCAVCLLLPEAFAAKSIFAGILFGAAILSTPRSHPFVLCFFVVMLGYSFIKKNAPLFRSLFLAGATGLLSIVAWTFHVGLNPVSWYLLLLRASAGDKVNSSPLLGGTWGHFSFDMNSLILPASLLAWLALLAIRRRNEHPPALPAILLVALLADAALTLLLTSRSLSYQIFWLVPFLPVAVAITFTNGSQSRWTRGMLYVLVAIILVTGFVRIGKVAEVISSWDARDPQLLKNFVCSQVPRNSTVYGTPGFYYAVEECESHFRFAQRWVATGLQSPLDSDDAIYRPGDFLLWPADMPLPKAGEFQEIAAFGSEAEKKPMAPTALRQLMKRAFPYTGGYTKSVLYKVR